MSRSFGNFHYIGPSRTPLLVEQPFRGTHLGFSMRVCIEDLVLDVGRCGLIWKHSFNVISKYIDDQSWLYSVIEYNHTYIVSLNSDHQGLQDQRIHDVAIMTSASIHYNKVFDLRSNNRVR